VLFGLKANFQRGIMKCVRDRDITDSTGTSIDKAPQITGAERLWSGGEKTEPGILSVKL
jgi:hypothetical protein